MLKIRLEGTETEVKTAIKELQNVFVLSSVSRLYPNRGATRPQGIEFILKSKTKSCIPVSAGV